MIAPQTPPFCRPGLVRNIATRIAFLSLIAVFAPLVAFGGELRLTSDGRLKFDPVFSDLTGSELVFVVQDRPSQLRLMKLKLPDLSQVAIFPNQTRSEFEPAVSPDGKLLVFVQNRGNLSLALVIRDMLLNKEFDIPPAGGFAGPHTPAIFPDGTKILYSFPDQERQRIYSANIDATDRKVVIESDGVNISPHVSPDSKRIVFASTRDDDYEIYSAAIDGSDLKRLTNSPRQDIRPRFSPDGLRIAFTSGRDGNYEIYIMKADGTGVTRITTNPERDDYPYWHPDGRHLIIVSERLGRHDLYLIDIP